MSDNLNIYTCLTPKYVADIGKCFFCECEAGDQIYCPPEKFASELCGPVCDYVIVPACYECMGALKNACVGTLSEQREIARNNIQERYGLALRLYQLWESAEAEELKRESSSFYGSISAALSLGQEANNRLRYRGFEVEEGLYVETENKAVDFSVFDQKFTSYKDALNFASRSYGVDIAFLANYVTPDNPDFDKGIRRWQKIANEQLRRDLEVNRILKRFCQQYKLDKKSVERCIHQLIDEGVSLEYEDMQKQLLIRLKI